MAKPTAFLRSPGRLPPDDDPEKTFILKPAVATLVAPAVPGTFRPSRLPIVLATGIATIAVLGSGWFLFAPPFRPLVAPSHGVPAAIAPSASTIRSATEAQIAEHRADRLTVFRVTDNPRIVVLDFPNLAEQGEALNRVAAFIEKASAPRDRILDDVELAREIAAAGDTPETYYYGHDYRVSDILRFFALADRDGVRLNPREEALRALVLREDLGDPATPHAIITVSQIGGDVIDAFTRRVILRHELSHGEYFTNPAYAAFARHAWTTLLTDAERAAFGRFLKDQSYDAANTDLIANEMQAFLVFTPDDRYISDEKLGVPTGTLRSLRERFVAAMPDGWLRTLATTPFP